VALDSDDPLVPIVDGLQRRQRRNSEAAAVTTSSSPPSALNGDGEVTEADLVAARAARARARTASTSKSSTRNVVEWVAVVAAAVLIAVVVRTFIFQTFWIPSPSMATTLVENDRVLVNKLSYTVGDIERGDVVVFERPGNMATSEIKDLIKRVVALPGERVSIIDGTVRINGRPLSEPYTDGQATEAKVGCGNGRTAGIDSEAGLEIPAGHVLVMGDNRTNSDDGRCFGPIATDLIVGRAFVIMWPPSKIGGL
jgi:signal peptidase I